MKEPMGAGPPPFFFCFIPPGGMDQREEKKIWILYFSYSFLDIDDFWRARADELMLGISSAFVSNLTLPARK
jgi:hypothetical protein